MAHATLTDGRVLLRPLAPGDRDPLYAAVDESREEVGRWMGWCHPDYALEHTEQWITFCERNWAAEDGDRDFGLFDAKTGEALGGIGINQFNRVQHFANLGYWVRTSRARRGLATDGVRLLARWGFGTLGLARIEIVAQVDNAASRRVAEKAGCTFEGIARSRIAFRDRHVDAALYSLIPGDLAAS
jgi:ribosomal-protein-serine acetyltransferase